MREIWLQRVVHIGLVGIALGTLSTFTYVDIDLFHSMANFREAIAVGRIPTEDVFSYVPTVKPMIHHEWGTGALLYLLTVSSGLGAAGLMITKYVLSTAVVAGCYSHARRLGASLSVFAPFALMAMILARIGFTTIRAHLFSMLFMVILLLFLQEDRRGKRWWIAVWLPLYVVWINLHAGFVLGLGLVVFHILERLLVEIIDRKPIFGVFWQVRYLVGVALAMVLLVLLNPYGFEYIPHLWYALLLDRSQHIKEWAPIWDPAHGILRVFTIPFHALYVTVIAYSVLKLRLRDMPNLFFLLATAWLSVFHVRYLSILAVAWICCTPAYIENTRLGEALKSFWVNRQRFLFIFWIACGALGLFSAIRHHFWHLRIPTTMAKHGNVGGPIYPVGAVDYLADQSFSGNMMVPFTVGAYVSWKLYPAVKVSIDSRFEAAYPPELLTEHIKFYGAKDGWMEILNRYPTDIVLVPRYGPIDKLLDEQAGMPAETSTAKWRRVYKDDGYSVFARSEIADRFEVVDNTGKPIIGSFP